MSLMTQQPALPGMDSIARRQLTPSDLISQALENGGDPVAIAAVIKELVALEQSQQRFEWEREERRMNIDFNSALTRVQEKVAFVNNDTDREKGSRYASFEALDRALRPNYLGEGFALSFDSEPSTEPRVTTVVCHLSREAITRDYRIPILVDGSGPKGGGVMTGSQASVAAFSYGCRALLRRIFNVRTGEEDNDGNAVQANPQVIELIEVIKAAATLQDAKDAYGKAFTIAREEKDGGRAMAAVVAAFEGIKKDFRK